MRTGYRMLDNVRTLADMRIMEDDPLERYDVPRCWLELELFGLASFFETYDKNAEPEQKTAPVIPKRPMIFENIVIKSVPLFLRL